MKQQESVPAIELIARPDAAALAAAVGPVLPAGSEALLNRYAGRPATTLAVARSAGTVTAAWLLTPLAWDSSIFGLTMGRLEPLLAGDPPPPALFVQLADAARRDGCQHLHTRVGLGRLATAQALTTAGFSVVDIQITLAAAAGAGTALPALPPGLVIRRGGPDDAAATGAVTDGGFTDTRFVADRRFPRAAVDRLYREWVANALRDARREVLLLEEPDRGRVLGFVINAALPDGSIGYIDLIAIARDERGRGLGTRLAQQALARLLTRSPRAEIRTQAANLAAVRSFMAAGFRTYAAGTALPAGISLHAWLD